MRTQTDPRTIDWTNRRQVCAYADELGPGNIVVKHANRKNFNITHETRTDLWRKDGVMVVHRVPT